MPSPWVPEAAAMLNQNPGLEVGVHLALTSEWTSIKWRPLTHAPSLVNPTFLESATDEFLRRSIIFGRPGTSMAAYGIQTWNGTDHDFSSLRKTS